MAQAAIISAVYNTLPYLPDLRASLETQTCSDFILLLTDDGSTDGSLEYLKEWSAEDPRIRLMALPENAGQSTARNQGIEYLDRLATYQPDALPPYTLFVDSDDVLVPETLERAISLCEERELDILEFSADTFFQSDELAERFSNFKDFYHRDFAYEGTYTGPDYLCDCYKYEDFTAQPCLRLQRTSLLLDNHVRFYNGIIHEDNLFSFEVLIHGKAIAYVPEVLYRRRIREDSTMTHPKSWRNVEGYYRCGIEAARVLDGFDLTDEQWETLRWLVDSFFFNASLDVKALEGDVVAEGLQSFRPFDRAMFYYCVQRRIDAERELHEAEERSRDEGFNEGLTKGTEETEERFRQSTSFKVGRAMTALPRKLRGKK